MKLFKHTLLMGFLSLGILSCTSDDISDVSTNNFEEPKVYQQNLDEKEVSESTLQNLENLLHYLNLPTTRAGVETYPKWYGGEYVDENGTIVVLATQIPQMTRATIQEKLSNVTFKHCETPYSELQDVMYQIREQAEAKNDFIYSNVAFYGIDIKSNAVQVGLFKNTESNIL